MTRRAAIAALLTATGGFVRRGKAQQTGSPFEPIVVTFQAGPIKDLRAIQTCQPSTDGQTMVCDQPTLEEPQYALIVRYGLREVKLTATEIMDALVTP